MLIGVIRESGAGQTRVAATPATAKQLLELGKDVVVQSGTGIASGFPDEAYIDSAGGPLKPHVVLRAKPPLSERPDGLREGATMAETNADFDDTAVLLLIGAHDTVNPAATEDPSSPIAGTPVQTVWEADNVIVFKRSMASGYAGVQNPLFVPDNAAMLFGNAKERVEDILHAV